MSESQPLDLAGIRSRLTAYGESFAALDAIPHDTPPWDGWLGLALDACNDAAGLLADDVEPLLAEVERLRAIAEEYKRFVRETPEYRRPLIERVVAVAPPKPAEWAQFSWGVGPPPLHYRSPRTVG